MNEEEKNNEDVKENNELLELVMAIIAFLIMGSLFMTFYMGMINHIGNMARKEIEDVEAKLSVETLNQCKSIAKAQERTVARGMTVHSSYWRDYKDCIRASAIHKEQYGKEDLIKM